MNPRRTRLVFAALLCVCALAGCGAAKPVKPTGDGVPKSWYAALDKNYAAAAEQAPLTSVPQLSTDSGCDLTTSVEIQGKSTSKQFGSGISTLGSSGRRYLCEFDDPSITLVVADFKARSEFAEVDAARGAHSEAGNKQSAATYTIGKRKIMVVKTSYPTNRTHVDYGASYLDSAHLGLVRLQVETTNERGLIKSYTSRQAAKDLSGLLDSDRTS